MYLALSVYVFAYYIIYNLHGFAYDIRISWYKTWFCIWIRPLKSVLRDIYAIRRNRFDGISAYIGAPGARCSSTSGFVITNVLQTGVQPNGDKSWKRARKWKRNLHVRLAWASAGVLESWNSFKLEIFKLNVTLKLRNWMPITYTVLQPKLATYSSLISCGNSARNSARKLRTETPHETPHETLQLHY